MASKRRLDTSEDSPLDPLEDGQGKKQKSENGAARAESREVSAVDVKVAEVTNEAISVEWNSSDSGKLFSVTLEGGETVKTEETKADGNKSCRIEFSDLQPLTNYKLTIKSSEKGEQSTTLEAMTRPSLEMPEIEEVQEGCAHLTLAPLPEDQAKDVEAYLLLVRPLEDAEGYPDDGIKDPTLKAKLEAVVQPPFYLAYEFTQDELTEETGGQVQVGSGADKKDGKYGTLQDPKLTSGGFYRVVFVVIMKLDGEEKLFVEESCRMLVK